MSFRTKRVLFWSPFYAIVEFFVINYYLSLFDIDNFIIPFILAVVLWIIQTIPMLFEEKKSSNIGRFLSKVFGVWEWFLLMLILAFIVIYMVSIFITIPKIVIGIILAMILLIGIYSYYNAHKIVVKKKTLKFEKLNKEYNIVHLSDVHFGSIRHRDIIHDLADKLVELSDSCDLVVISGDLADGSCVVEEDDFLELKKVKIPIIFTSGNHDYYPGLDSVHKACENAGIIILENKGMSFDDLNIYGLSYSFSDIDMPSTDDLLNFIDDNKINIVNYHVPNGWSNLANIGFDIQLSGHTHGGQFYPMIFFGGLLYEGHNMGLFSNTINGFTRYLHVTCGLGSMDVPMRWGTNSEIVILKLRKSIN